MANPQKEDGYTAIANEILEAIIYANLNGTEYQVLLYVIRKTYGFHKKEDWISYTQFQKATGKSRVAIWKAIMSLVNKRLLVNNSKPGAVIYRLNKDYTQWVVNKRLLVNKRKQGSKQSLTQLVNKSKPTKETITKETIQKKGNTPSQKMRNFIVTVKKRSGNYDTLVKRIANKCGTTIAEAVIELDDFISYWTEKNKSGLKERWELQQTFEYNRRLITWLNNSSKFDKNNNS